MGQLAAACASRLNAHLGDKSARQQQVSGGFKSQFGWKQAGAWVGG